jgi:signal transduction histidine kinase
MQPVNPGMSGTTTSSDLTTRFLAAARSVHWFRLAPDGTIVACNPAVTLNLKRPASDLVGRSISAFLTEADADLIQRMGDAATAGQELLLHFLDAENQRYCLRCLVHVDPDAVLLIGEPSPEPPADRDLADARQELYRLRRKAADLLSTEKLVRLGAERETLEARRGEAEAEAAALRLKHGLAVIAHELRQPLTPLLMAVELIRRGADRSLLERATRIIDRQVLLLQRLVDDLLDTSRVIHGKIQLQKTRFDLREVVSTAVEALQPQVTSLQHSLTVKVPPTPLYIQGDSARLQQVVTNLLSNAAKFTPQHGRIQVTLEQEGGQAVLRVRDNGAGIPPEVMPRLFQLFAQAADGSKGGLGIGLALVRLLVELHEGSVEAFSEGPGRGSEFVVSVPAGKDEAPGKSP